MKRIIALALVFCMALVMSSAFAEEKITLELMLHQRESVEKLQRIGAAFSELHPNVEIVVNQPADYSAATQSRFLSGDMPDLWTWSNDQQWYPYFAENYFLDLTGKEWLTSSINETTLANVTFNGKIVGLPLFINAWGFFYNVDLFQQYNVAVPTTEAEFWAACETFKAAGITPIEVTDADAWTAFNVFERFAGLIYQDQGELFNRIAAGEDSATTYPPIRKVAEMVSKVHAYAQADPISTDYMTGISEFANGKAAMFPNGTWVFGQISEAGDANVDCFVFPAEKAEDTRLATNLDMSVNICANTEHPEECLAFLEFLSQPENAQKLTDDCRAISVNLGVTNSIAAFQRYSDYANAGKTYGIARNYWRSGTNALLTPLVQVLGTDGDIDAFLSAVDDEVKMHYAD